MGGTEVEESKMNALRRFLREEEGISSLEYALLAVVVALVIWVGAKVFGQAVSDLFTRIGGALDGIEVGPLP
jgi:Flp pilus assembly pilin Flp